MSPGAALAALTALARRQQPSNSTRTIRDGFKNISPCPSSFDQPVGRSKHLLPKELRSGAVRPYHQTVESRFSISSMGLV